MVNRVTAKHFFAHMPQGTTRVLFLRVDCLTESSDIDVNVLTEIDELMKIDLTIVPSLYDR